MQRKVFGPINLNTSITAFNAGKCLHCLGRPDCALCYYNLFTKAIFSSIKAKLMTQETVLILQNIACAFHQDHSLKHANTFYRLALRSAHMVLEERILVKVPHPHNQLAHHTITLQIEVLKKASHLNLFLFLIMKFDVKPRTCMTEESFSMRTRSMHLFPKYVCNMMLVRIRVLVTMALLVGETETAFLVVATGDVGCWSRLLYQLRCFYQ
jgi:hypothetical protein